MRYEAFVDCWNHALQDSGLRIMGVAADEKLDLRNLDRLYEVRVEPVGGQDAEPFFVTAKLSWRWWALHSARTATTEEDMLTELLGRKAAQGVETERPWLRVDIELAATLPYGKPGPMPSTSTWGRWVREVHERLESIEPLLPEETTRRGKDGALEVLGWQGMPQINAECGVDGEPRYNGVRLAAWQAVELPRQWDHPDRADEDPEEQLEDLFGRVRQALTTWMECLDVLSVDG